jgi:hypothetical protein
MFDASGDSTWLRRSGFSREELPEQANGYVREGLQPRRASPAKRIETEAPDIGQGIGRGGHRD